LVATGDAPRRESRLFRMGENPVRLGESAGAENKFRVTDISNIGFFETGAKTLRASPFPSLEREGVEIFR